jgi:hypothetical protein
MARPKMPASKTITICMKVSETEAAEIDTARGIEDRGTWLRRAALVAVERQRPPEGAADRQAEAVRQNLGAALRDV